MPDIELELTQVAHGGEAIGRHEGKVVFVPFAMPGEKVRVRLLEEKRAYARAELLEVLTPAPERVQPPCPYFATCGGCHWQHIAYEKQLELKLEVVADQLRRLGHIIEPPCDGIVPAEKPWGYRNNIQLHRSANGSLGFVASDNRNVIPIPECLLAHDLVDEMHAALDFTWSDLERLSLRAGLNTGERLILIETKGEDSPELELDLPLSCVHQTGSGKLRTLIGSNYFSESLAGRVYRVSAPSFFQVNTEQAENLAQVVLDFANLQGGERVLDLFCGVGTFSLPLAAQAGEVIGVEAATSSAADAEYNGRDTANFTILEGDAAAVMPHLEGEFPVVVMDPPRSGCGQEIISALADLNPQRLIYVSCDPATLARDTAQLTEAGFNLERLVAVDMFPQTAHVETVCLLKRA